LEGQVDNHKSLLAYRAGGKTYLEGGRKKSKKKKGQKERGMNGCGFVSRRKSKRLKKKGSGGGVKNGKINGRRAVQKMDPEGGRAGYAGVIGNSGLLANSKEGGQELANCKKNMVWG